ncbi:alpha/beta hydrolase [Spiroplasma endosymbiont of Anurida maritima]|uniref:alpha/beta hydrolase n=1 Tax=Spiroplasma endosymbiont of Anurida maritima TaxID=2967972 RepID=UPI0036D40C66
MEDYFVPDQDELEKYLNTKKGLIKSFLFFRNLSFIKPFFKYNKNYKNIEEYCFKIMQKFVYKNKITNYFHKENYKSIEENFLVNQENIKINYLKICSNVKSKNNKKWVVLTHGINSNKFSSFSYSALYINKGYNVLVYDLIDHGKSDKGIVSFGAYEKKDLKNIVDFLIDSEDVSEIILHGMSMGSFITGQFLHDYYQEYVNIISKVIIDSTYDTLQRLVFKMIKDLKNDPYQSYFAIQNLFLTKYGFDIDDVVPFYDTKSIKDLPILFLNGANDKIIPLEKTRIAFENKVRNEREILSSFVVYNAAHIKGLKKDHTFFLKTIYDFLNI